MINEKNKTKSKQLSASKISPLLEWLKINLNLTDYFVSGFTKTN